LIRAPRLCGPLYDPWWQRRLVIIFVGSLYLPGLVVAVSLMSSSAHVTVEGMIEASILLYALQVAIALVIAQSRIPEEIKQDWEHRRIKAASRRHPDR